jgi:hypothetical protein
MFVKTFGSAVYGVEAITITIEVNWTSQGKEYCIVGLHDSAIKESMQRKYICSVMIFLAMNLSQEESLKSCLIRRMN